jgi:predicted enzyme related to lactoylglutathione lyase
MKRVVTDSWAMGSSRDIKRSVAFYAKFGLKPSMRMPFYVEMKVPGGTVIGLHSEGAGRSGRKRTARRNDKKGWGIMLRVKDIKKTVSGLKQKKVKCTAVRKAPGGAMFSTAHDPDGNRLLLLQILK